MTGDESWFHYYEPETKSQSSQWKRKYEAPPVKVKCARPPAREWPPFSGIERNTLN